MEPQAGGGEVRRESSEADIPLHIFAAKVGPVHVHGELAKHAHPEAHPPQHHDPQSPVKYTAAIKEALHDVHEHPPGVKLHGKSGVEAWDHVQDTLPSHHGHHHK